MKAKEISRETGKDIREAREEVKPKKDTAKYYDISDGGRTNQAMDAAYYEMELEDAERKRKEAEKTSEAIKKVKSDLGGTFPNTLAHQLAVAKSMSVPMDDEEPDPQPRGKGRPLQPKGTKKAEITKKTSKKGRKKTKEVEEPLVSQPMIVNDEETQQKRKTEDTPKDTDSKKTRKGTSSIKKEDIAEPKTRGRRKGRVEADDVEVGNILLDKTSKPEDLSAKEMRNQLNLRFPNSVGDWGFKNRQQLIKIIKEMKAKGTW